ncbi:hypothetical protein SAMN05216178_6920 [Pseudomonas saponiphila]|jgi:hypothetical protein|uniref:ART-PolyVal-like domain-containing protein n=1 Tax=Pseudomonas saponiphila TaxID=556534 RepID=A0A1H5A241_9PSED|nr:hypothetical protein [Pseudomonas saponiphila]SED35670.1 hypothetical protein SAMN05216178_6920 [Pseudomonas saponiphila]
MFNLQATQEFKEWFRESAAVTEAGAPLDLFHGTYAQYSEIAPSKRGLFGSGIYLTPYSGNAQEYGDIVLKVHASLQAPVRGTAAEIRSMRLAGETDADFTARLQLFGYDGIIVVDACGFPYTVVAFASSQVKIASQNIWAADFAREPVIH